MRRWFGRLLILALVTSVAVAAAPAAWRLAGYDSVIPDDPPPPPTRAGSAPAIDVGPVLAVAPFGSAVPAAAPERRVEAPLDLTLLGVIVRLDPSRSTALIAHNGDEANYRIGEEIADVATLVAVTQTDVTLEVDGVERRLAFDGAAEPPDAESVPTGADRLAAILSTGTGPSISEQVDAAQKARPTSTQDYIDMWRDRIIANPSEVLDAIGLEPVDNGYRITENHDSGVSRAGLQAGDIVTSVNGQPVGDIDSDRVLYDRVAESGLARIEIERGDRTITMSFPLQ